MDLKEMLYNVIRVLISQKHSSQIFNTRKQFMVESSLMASSTSLHKHREASPSKDKNN